MKTTMPAPGTPVNEKKLMPRMHYSPNSVSPATFFSKINEAFAQFEDLRTGELGSHFHDHVHDQMGELSFRENLTEFVFVSFISMTGRFYFVRSGQNGPGRLPIHRRNVRRRRAINSLNVISFQPPAAPYHLEVHPGARADVQASLPELVYMDEHIIPALVWSDEPVTAILVEADDLSSGHLLSLQDELAALS
jgi:hypothetical protein